MGYREQNLISFFFSTTLPSENIEIRLYVNFMQQFGVFKFNLVYDKK